MSISSVSSSTSSSILGSLSSSSSSSSTSAVDAALPDDSASVSEQAKLRKKLEELAQTDPAKFKEVAQSISDSLAAEAKDASGDKGKLLSDLSAKFASAAKSGDVSDLKPSPRAGGPRGPPPGGPPPPHPSDASASSDDSDADTSPAAVKSHHPHKAIDAYLQSSGGTDAVSSVIEKTLEAAGIS